MNLSIAYSPCPNDTYIFDALAHRKIPMNDLSFECFLADVEELNRAAQMATFDISKISIAAYPSIADKYQILNSGSALGKNNGPLLISKKPFTTKDINTLRIAIPGIHTTANLLLSIAFPDAKNKTPMLFSDIEEAVLKGDVDAGLIIHESRFTYQAKGLKKVIDLGEYWQETFDMPVPLGCIVVKRSLSNETKKSIDNIIYRSLDFANKNKQSSQAYIKEHAQNMEDDTIAKHIGLYVNDFSLSLGQKGKEAILFMFKEGKKAGLLDAFDTNVFVD
jgi:1,4-dihydroxy-6-naphthoate synthase